MEDPTQKEKNDERDAKVAQLDLDSVERAREIYDTVLEQFPNDFGKALSKKERQEKALPFTTLIYGEIDFDSFGLMFQKLRHIYGLPGVGYSGPRGQLQSRGGIFYDLGCGIGRPLVAAACLYPFDVCTGIEILEGLYEASNLVVESYHSKGKSELKRAIDTVIETKHGDLLDMNFKDWRDGDVVFVNSTCFDDQLMSKIANLSIGMKKGSFVVTLTKRLPIADFDVLEYELHEMSWGGATVYIHQKSTEPREMDPDSDAESDNGESRPITRPGSPAVPGL